ncbi:hypothetical protein A2715_02080 [Candidatus Woesebacteria bacterium RIFCSPHIGHO2_01_FULL_39_32]|uniref:DNA-binding response regulator n=2 Tax=Candidatus Woeseibacteriota TaxID=1752722 RepID=A0A0G0SYU8_9BACT|nr:MAG: DNA-binding response regulator [Candidatus Woesebacteria bacterium GW2011_GWA1_39_8]OGM03446.1 MAG: hypothetical protein A2124_02315 [Candidatus Woesebacteria bacterium GWB1_37_5]OGM23943.1 MAG: hypothetical protein A2715_02080 [Candidatus Woesebacteria bacterium RIFCSPHIGHO2_01_FULL_39_32]OGM37449.1 MAG: hypothetical protein A3F01_03315 [Candidatus Woesebacteria bacterium RIFCSPHIGHO2_12_FULL_38_11]OGM64132.1 MAG: hypothetical protein A2893_03320 [Candidatus Woesebacteria bacterium RIF
MNRRKILLIEDNFTTLDIYKKTLEREGLRTISVTFGEEALFAAKAGKPDLILLDLLLPGSTSGLEALKEIKNEKGLSKIPVVVITNLHTEEKIAKQLGAVDYLVKTNTSLTEVVATVKKRLQIN